MSKLVAYTISGNDNKSYMLQNTTCLDRCQMCGALLNRPQLISSFKLKIKRDISATYDNYLIVSQRFVDEWQLNGGVGLHFLPLPEEPGYYVLEADHIVEFDVVRRETRFGDYCPSCGQYDYAVGATPSFLKKPFEVDGNQAARSDIMFGSGDTKCPVFIIPLKIGNALKRAKLSGLCLDKVLD